MEVLSTGGSVPMHGAHSYGPQNVTQEYSPVALSYDWPTVGRLMLMVCCSCIGTTMNGFFVAAFFVEYTLKRVGNVFLACVGLSELIITAGVMPISAVVLLSGGEWDTLPVCKAVQFLTEMATYNYSLFFLLVASETFSRLCRPILEYNAFMSMKIGIACVFVFVLSALLAGLGVYHDMDYDYCERSQYGNYQFRILTYAFGHAIPSILTIIFLIIPSVHLQRQASTNMCFRRSQEYKNDVSATNLHLTSYIIYVMMWTPYLVVVHDDPSTTDSKYYHSVWIGMSRSVFSSLIYSSMNQNFRRAFANLFYYCCCKSTLNSSYSNRHRRAVEYRAATGDVRVHIMHQAVNPSNTQRGASSSRETQEL